LNVSVWRPGNEVESALELMTCLRRGIGCSTAMRSAINQSSVPRGAIHSGGPYRWDASRIIMCIESARRARSR
jgi:hypothetical protein